MSDFDPGRDSSIYRPTDKSITPQQDETPDAEQGTPPDQEEKPGFRQWWREANERSREKTAQRQARIKAWGERTAQKVEESQAARQEAAFSASPVGQARTAYEAGHTIFQTILDVRETSRSLLSQLTHSMGPMDTRSQNVGGHGEILSAICAEGWKLIEAGFVYEQTRQDSRDKFLASGQQVIIQGRTIGIYLFERVERATES